jgi:hypothetical protein
MYSFKSFTRRAIHVWLLSLCFFAGVAHAQTLPLLTQPDWTNRQFSFKVIGETSSLFEILASTSLTNSASNWTVLSTFTNLTGSYLYTDPATNLHRRFYQAQQLIYPRRPVGVYARVVVADIVNHKPKANWTNYFNCFYAELLANPAISGLQLGIGWDYVNPGPGVYDWSCIQPAFDQVDLWNSNHPANPKNIQLIFTPGFDTPGWVLTNIMSADGSCDPMLTNHAAAPNCGAVTFVGYIEGPHGNVLPLPWDPTYKYAWSNFLSVVNQQYGDNPSFVSISISGPTAASAEMIMPSDTTTCPCHTNNECGVVCASPTPQPGNNLTPNQIWNELLLNHYGPAYTNSNRAFVEEWTNAINLYEGIFHNVTLVITPANGEGFPFQNPDVSDSPLCTYSADSSCTATATILNYFENYPSQNGNGKGAQISGLNRNVTTLTNNDVGPAGIRYLSAQFQSADPGNQIVGGAQFDHAYSSSNNADPEQQEFDVLANFFNGTLAVNGTATFTNLFKNVTLVNRINPPLTTPAPINYLQVFHEDVLYAQSHGCVVITNGVGGQTITMSAQDLLNAANQLLHTIAENPYPPGAIPQYAPACSNTPPAACPTP